MRLSRWEKLGAWLGLWTPPREAEVPPVPWRAIAIGGAGLLVVLAVVAALVLPGVNAGKRRAGDRDRREAAARHARLLATADREQRPRTGSGPRDPAGAPAAERVQARSALLAAARDRLLADARSRTGDTVTGTDCDPFPRSPDPIVPVRQLRRRAAGYQCVAVTSRFEKGVIGIPFRLVVRFAEGGYAFCRIVPLGDRDRLTHPLPEACRT
jgi:hypothetical protein